MPMLLRTDMFIMDSDFIITGCVGIISIITLLIFIKIMPKRTAYGNEMFRKIRGFKNFLENAEKPQLEAMVMQNPEYFYNILPYTYALGVSERWINQFETIAMKVPDWYSGSDSFSMHEFGSFMHDTMNSAQRAMTSTPSYSDGSFSSGSSSSGGSSGGGFSGGGSGGGGGSSW